MVKGFRQSKLIGAAVVPTFLVSVVDNISADRVARVGIDNRGAVVSVFVIIEAGGIIVVF